MQQVHVQFSAKGAIVCYIYFNPYYLANAPISEISFTPKYPYSCMYPYILMLHGAIAFLNMLKIHFTSCMKYDNTKLYEYISKVFSSMLKKLHDRDTCIYVWIHTTGN